MFPPCLCCKNVLIISFIILSVVIRINVESKEQYVQPLMMGMQVAIPWDIANIWNRPVSFSPLVSTVLGVSLLYILFFGVITAPFGYMFGVPSQKYVIGTAGADSLVTVLLQNADLWRNYTIAKEAEDAANAQANNNNNTTTTDNSNNTPRGFSDTFTKPLLRKILKYEWDYPEFTDRVFQFIPGDVSEDEVCQQLLLCHAHSALKTLPDLATPAYRVFSKTLTNVPKPHRKAIKTGLTGGDCDTTFLSCPSDIYSLSLRIFLGGLPSWLRKYLILPQM